MTRKSYREHQAVDDYVKIFSGLLLVSLGLGRRLGALGGAIATVVGASQVAEGISGYSPIGDLLRSIDSGKGENEAPTKQFATLPRTFPWTSRDDEGPETSFSSPPSGDQL